MVLGISTTRFFRVSLTSMYSVFISCPGEYRRSGVGVRGASPGPPRSLHSRGPLAPLRSLLLSLVLVREYRRSRAAGARRFPRTPSLASLAGAPCPAPFRSLLLSSVLVREYRRSGVGVRGASPGPP